MIKIEGKLTVRSINGKNGAFSVGKLATSVGEFVVKDALLDQFPEGSYDGEFVIAKIFPTSYSIRGNIVVEVRAIIDEFVIDDAKEGEQHDSSTPTIPDPLDEEKKGAGQSTPPPVPAQSTTPVGEAEEDNAGKPEMEFDSEQDKLDYELFGDLYDEVAMLADGIKLDPTVGREKFRQQRDRLKELGYRFDSTTQSWSKPIGK